MESLDATQSAYLTYLLCNLQHNEEAVIQLLQFFVGQRYTNANYSAYLLYVYYMRHDDRKRKIEQECIEDLFAKAIDFDPYAL